MPIVKGTGPAGLVSTEGVLAEQKVLDMDPVIKMLDLDTDQFTTMLDDLGTKTTAREKVNWLEDEYAPKMVRISAGIASARHGCRAGRRRTRTSSRSGTRSGT